MVCGCLIVPRWRSSKGLSVSCLMVGGFSSYLYGLVFLVFLLKISRIKSWHPGAVGGKFARVGLMEFCKCKNVFFCWILCLFVRSPPTGRALFFGLGLWGCPLTIGVARGVLQPVWFLSCSAQVSWAGLCTSQGPELAGVASCCLLKKAGWTLQHARSLWANSEKHWLMNVRAGKAQQIGINSLWHFQVVGIPSYPVIAA